MFTIGADPEVFLVNKENVLVSAIDKVGGSKHFPRPLPIGKGFAVQEDNVALEYNIPAAENKQQFIDNITLVMQYLSDEISVHNLTFSKLSAAAFPVSELLDPRAMEFGCDPDFNAWKDGAINPKPKADDHTLRSCGGHVHLGYEFADKDHIIKTVKLLDLYLAIPSLFMDDGDLRRKLYGAPGAYRRKSFGLEYRVLSNFWVFNPDYIGWVYDNVGLALESSIDPDKYSIPIQKAINENNKDIASSLIKQFNIPVIYA